MPTRVVTISHAWGAGGESIGRTVAEKLGFRYVDDEIISLAADKHGLEPAAVADAERRKSLLFRIAEDLSKGSALQAAGAGGVMTPESIGLRKSDDARALIIDAIVETAERGEVVIVAHAASIPLAGRDDLLRVFITASIETRVDRVADTPGADTRGAEKFVRQSDTARAYYFQRFYEIEEELPTHYDLVLNTDALSYEEACDIIIAAARRKA